MRFLNAGNNVYINGDEVTAFLPAQSLSEEKAKYAIDVSGGTKRTAVMMKNRDILLVDLRYSTFYQRLQRCLG